MWLKVRIPRLARCPSSVIDDVTPAAAPTRRPESPHPRAARVGRCDPVPAISTWLIARAHKFVVEITGAGARASCRYSLTTVPGEQRDRILQRFR